MQNNIGKDEVYLSYTDIDDNLKVSRSTFSRGISELIEKRFIAAKPLSGSTGLILILSGMVTV